MVVLPSRVPPALVAAGPAWRPAAGGLSCPRVERRGPRSTPAGIYLAESSWPPGKPAGPVPDRLLASRFARLAPPLPGVCPTPRRV